MIPPRHRPRSNKWQRRNPATWLPRNTPEFIALCIAPELPYLSPGESTHLWFDEFDPITPERAVYMMGRWAESQLVPKFNLTFETNLTEKFIQIKRATTDEPFSAANPMVPKNIPIKNSVKESFVNTKPAQFIENEPSEQFDKVFAILEQSSARTAIKLIPCLPELKQNKYTILVDYPAEIPNLLAVKYALDAYIDDMTKHQDTQSNDNTEPPHRKTTCFKVEPQDQNKEDSGIRITNTYAPASLSSN